MKKRTEEILRSKEQPTEQSLMQSTEQSTVQSTLQSNGAYVYGVGILSVLAIGVCVFFTYNISKAKNKKQDKEKKQDQPPKRRHML